MNRIRNSSIAAMKHMQNLQRKQIQHLQVLRQKLVSTYLLIITGAGYLCYAVLTSSSLNVASMIASAEFWIVTGVVVAVLSILATAFAVRVAHYTDVIRIDLSRTYAIDRHLKQIFKPAIELADYPDNSWTTGWRGANPLTWPAELLVFGMISSLVVATYLLLLTRILCGASLTGAIGLAVISFPTMLAINRFIIFASNRRDKDSQLGTTTSDGVANSDTGINHNQALLSGEKENV